tara:strand:+ start:3334 stop:3918 length:585 start_codon:yes stop_codon:yes gene_type:complete
MKISLLGLFAATAIAMPVSAQEFYLGASFSSASHDAIGSVSNTVIGSGDGQILSAFVGTRGSVGSNVFLGGELHYLMGSGYYNDDGGAALSDDVKMALFRAQVGYEFSNFRVYAFAGIGKGSIEEKGYPERTKGDVKTYGLGVETDINERFAVRVEAGMTTLSGLDTCCVYTNAGEAPIDIENSTVSIGALYRF